MEKHHEITKESLIHFLLQGKVSYVRGWRALTFQLSGGNYEKTSHHSCYKSCELPPFITNTVLLIYH